MIFLQLFWVFTKIGVVNFGGGYAMLSLIQAEVVQQHGWLTAREFTDIVAISQMTPGPIGINAATYVGYSSVVSAGYSPLMGVLGSVVATFSVVWIPFLLMMFLSYLLLKNKDKPWLKGIFMALRPAIVGLIASAALILITEENFGHPIHNAHQFLLSVALFVLAFIATYRYKVNPLLLLAFSAVAGVVFYGFIIL